MLGNRSVRFGDDHFVYVVCDRNAPSSGFGTFTFTLGGKNFNLSPDYYLQWDVN